MLKTVILWLAVLAAVLVPCLKLFQEGDWLFYVIRDSAMHKEWLEIGILAVLLAAVCLCIRNRKVLLGTLAGIILLVAYLHSMLLPLLLAGLWFTVLMLTGNIVAGITVAIVVAGILSLFGQCTPNSVLLVTLAVQLILRLVFRSIGTFPLGRKQSIGTFPLGRKRPIGTLLHPTGNTPSVQSTGDASFGRKDRLLLALIVLVLLVQIGRANECIDFDSLWYGVRSLQVLTPGGSIFEDLGLVGMVYTYPKGFEILTLPLNMTESYAVISVFNLFLFVYGLFVTANVADRLTSFSVGAGKEKNADDAVLDLQFSPYAKLAVLFTVLVPGIVNMTLSAKPDLITWLLQLVMLDRFFATVSETKKKEKTVTGKDIVLKALPVISVYLLSLTMKPTALIFSTALLGMMFVWTVYRAVVVRRFEQQGRSLPAENSQQGRSLLDENSQQGHSFGQQGTSLSAENYIELILSVLALAIVWGRTLKLTGMPFTSVFTGVLEKLGFTMKYPFSSRALPQSWQEGSQLLVALKRVVKMLLMPDGKDMSHVIIAWGGSLFFVLGLMTLWNVCVVVKNRKKNDSAKENHSKEKSGASPLLPAALTVFLPFIVTCFVTLTMLYQVDGNYYMMLYSIVIILAVVFEQEGRSLLTENEQQGHSFVQVGTSLSSDFVQQGTSLSAENRAAAAALALILALQFVIMTMTNWAGVAGFTKIQANKGYFSHKEYYKAQLTEVDGSLYDFLSADPRTRIVAFGEHPICLQFGCIAQSYNDITSPWGNVEIVNTADAFIDYLHFAKVDYVYGDAEHLSQDAWQWSKGLIDEMTERGILTDFVYEGENWVAKVN